MGNKIKIPSDCERRKELLNILVTTFNLDWHLKHLLLPSCICLTAIHDRLWYWKNIGYWQWTLKNYMDIYIYIHWWYCSSISQASIIPEGRWYCSDAGIDYGWVSEVRDSYQFTSEVSQYCFRVPNTRYCSRISNIVPDSLMSDTGPRY